MFNKLTILYIIFSYLLGSISFSYLIVKKFKKIDIRTEGSKNAGATNVLRNHGFILAFLVFLMDFLKGLVVTAIGKRVGIEFAILGLLFAVIGHDFPVFLKFKGGKGIATTYGGLVYLFPKITGICILLFMIIALVTRYISLASISSLLVLIFAIVLTNEFSLNSNFILFLLFILAVIKHISNIRRLLNGEENKLIIGGKK